MHLGRKNRANGSIWTLLEGAGLGTILLVVMFSAIISLTSSLTPLLRLLLSVTLSLIVYYGLALAVTVALVLIERNTTGNEKPIRRSPLLIASIFSGLGILFTVEMPRGIFSAFFPIMGNAALLAVLLIVPTIATFCVSIGLSELNRAPKAEEAGSTSNHPEDPAVDPMDLTAATDRK